MKTNAEWRLWGDRDPLYGVATIPGHGKHDATPWTDSDFYALGADWLDFAEHWNRYGMPRGTVVEIGCGAGRITSRLADAFERVIACDVSQGMLDYAKARIRQQNIDWRITDGLLPLNDNTVEAAFSCHVLQHLDSNATQLAYFRDIHRALRQGGSLMIHLCMHVLPEPNRAFSRIAERAYAGFLRLSGVKAAIKRARMVAGDDLYMHGVSYPQGQLYADLVGLGFARVEFATFPVRTNGSLHPFVFATKA